MKDLETSVRLKPACLLALAFVLGTTIFANAGALDVAEPDVRNYDTPVKIEPGYDAEARAVRNYDKAMNIEDGYLSSEDIMKDIRNQH